MQWREIPGTYYAVSETGHVFNIDRWREVRSKGGGRYWRYDLKMPDGIKTRSAHSLVMEAFVGPRPEGAVIMHLDHDRGNNAVENLQYGTQAENVEMTVGASRAGRKTPWDPLPEASFPHHLFDRHASIKAAKAERARERDRERYHAGDTTRARRVRQNALRATARADALRAAQPGEWRTVSRNPTYEVSDLGQVRNAKTASIKATRVHSGSTVPYLTVGLVFGSRKDGTYRVRHIAVHTLVLEAFAGPAPAGMQCRHLDGDPQNNRLSNLTWGTPAENYADQVAHGTAMRPPPALPQATVDAVRRAAQAGESYRAIAQRVGVSPVTVRNAAVGAGAYAGVGTEDPLPASVSAERRSELNRRAP